MSVTEPAGYRRHLLSDRQLLEAIHAGQAIIIRRLRAMTDQNSEIQQDVTDLLADDQSIQAGIGRITDLIGQLQAGQPVPADLLAQLQAAVGSINTDAGSVAGVVPDGGTPAS